MEGRGKQKEQSSQMEGEIRLDVDNQTERHSWMEKMKEKLSDTESIPKKKPSEKRKNTIYTIPRTIRTNFSCPDYKPCKVSFGPYHHGVDSCKETELIKESVVCYSLKRSNKTIEDYADALSQVVQDLKDAYDELDPKWQQDNDAFLNLMVRDGFFVLEIVNEARDWFKTIHRRVRNNDYDYSNPIWDIEQIKPGKLMEYYKRDMLLLENQIPILVLEKLVGAQMNESMEEAREYLHRDLLKFVHPSVRKIPKMDACLHVLDLYRQSLLFEEVKAITTKGVGINAVEKPSLLQNAVIRSI